MVARRLATSSKEGNLKIDPVVKSVNIDVDSVGTGEACTTSMTSTTPLTPVVLHVMVLIMFFYINIEVYIYILWDG